MKKKRALGFRMLVGIGILLTILLLLGQSFSLINYKLTVSMGLQESAEEITTLGIAWAKAFALGDTLIYIPLLIAGIFGVIKHKNWGFYTFFAALAISAYWPVVNLAAIYIGRNEINLLPEKYISFTILLPLITLYGLWGMWYLAANKGTLLK